MRPFQSLMTWKNKIGQQIQHQRIKPKKAEGGIVKKKPSMIMQIDSLKRKNSDSVVGSMNKNEKYM